MHKYLKISPFCPVELIHATYPIHVGLIEAPNEEVREDNIYKLSKKK